jgi:predicted nuclease with TOPRIM domain
MKNRQMLCILSTILILLTFSGCDSVDKTLEWKNKYEELNKQHVELMAKYEEGQRELKRLKSNGERYMENTKMMINDD